MSMNRTLLTDRVAHQAVVKVKEYNLLDQTLQGFSLRVQSSGAKSWVLRAKIEGKPKRVTLGDARRVKVDEARAAAHALLANGKPAPPVADKAKTDGMVVPTFAAFARTYQERKAVTWKPSGQRCTAVYLRVTLLPFFGNMLLDRITSADVARWFHDYGRLRPGGANRALAIIGNMFSCARDWGVLPNTFVSPTKGIKKNRRPRRGRVLNADEIERLGAALDRQVLARPDPTDIVRLLLLTGCRHGEIRTLRWKEVKQDRLMLSDSKTGPRQVLLGEPAREILKRRRRQRQPGIDHVFPHRREPTQPRGPTTSYWQMIRKQADLPDDLRLHDLRHTYASHAVMQGESLIVTGKLLGHRHTATTERYAHLTDHFLLEAAERVAGNILSLLEPGG